MTTPKQDTSPSFTMASGTVYEPMDLYRSQDAENLASGIGAVPWYTPATTPDIPLVTSGPRIKSRCQPTERRTEQPVMAGMRSGRLQIFSPAISPTSQSPVRALGLQDREKFPPTRRPAAAPVKKEPGPEQDGSVAYKLPAQTCFQRYMSVSDVDGLMQAPTRRVSLANAVSQAFNPMPSPMVVSVPSMTSSPTASSIADQQRDLFEALIGICTTAARTYWRSQFRSHSTAVVYRRRTDHGRHRVAPYDRPASQPCHVLLGAHRRRAHTAEAPRGLMDFLVRIADGLWERAIASGSHAEELQAVHRMGNLYSWGDRVLGAARGTDDLTDEAFYVVVMAARDLVSWLLCEDGKREIDALCEARWGLVGFGSGTVD